MKNTISNLRTLSLTLTLILIYSVAFAYPANVGEGEMQAPADLDPYASLVLSARSAYVFDVASGNVLYAKNEREPLPIASLTKIMTAIVAREIPLSDQTLLAFPGEENLWRLPALLQFLLVASSNDAAQAVEEGLGGLFSFDNGFVGAMNAKARELGFTAMRFVNATGLDVSESEPGAFGTAEEIARLFGYAVTYHPDIFAATREPTAFGVPNTNVRAARTTRLIASKTGFTDLAGGNLAVAFDVGMGHPVIAVVLGSGIETRFTDIESIIIATYTALN